MNRAFLLPFAFVGSAATLAPALGACTKAETPSTTCSAYCTEYERECPGNLSQYFGSDPAVRAEKCNAMCGLFKGEPAGNNQTLLACREDTLQRLIESPPVGDLANEPKRRALCVNAGPYSGLAVGDVAKCGASQCETFCKLNDAICTGQTSTNFAGKQRFANCLESCAALEVNGAFKGQAEVTSAANGMNGTAVQTGNSFSCRAYHTQAALARSDIHCQHADAPRSPVCNDDAVGGDAGAADAGASDAGADGGR